ncbi:MAG: DUF4411 family protein [Gemmatimonadetes bacterium]|nr:DUF4411 family protein [Gemmatimonadota bacterium]
MPVYCLDTSALLDGWNRHYPVDVVPTMWERLSDLAATGTIVCPDEVLREVLKKDDSLSKWVKGVKGLIVPLDTAQQIAVAEILAEFPRLVDTRKNRSIADPL